MPWNFGAGDVNPCYPFNSVTGFYVNLIFISLFLLEERKNMHINLLHWQHSILLIVYLMYHQNTSFSFVASYYHNIVNKILLYKELHYHTSTKQYISLEILKLQATTNLHYQPHHLIIQKKMPSKNKETGKWEFLEKNLPNMIQKRSFINKVLPQISKGGTTSQPQNHQWAKAWKGSHCKKKQSWIDFQSIHSVPSKMIPPWNYQNIFQLIHTHMTENASFMKYAATFM